MSNQLICIVQPKQIYKICKQRMMNTYIKQFIKVSESYFIKVKLANILSKKRSLYLTKIYHNFIK